MPKSEDEREDIQSSHPRQRYLSILLKGWRHAHGIKSSYSVGTYCS